MQEKVSKYMKEEGLVHEGMQVVVALSGGADSVCLLLVLKSLAKKHKFTLHAIHVEHGIRGEESKKDAAFVEKLCADYDIPLTIKEINVPSFAKENGLGLEEGARILRYKAFYEEGLRLAEEIGLEEEIGQKKTTGKEIVFALGHHMEDQAETVLFQLLRGSGITGLGGMSPSFVRSDRTTYIRPLLTCTREEIEAYLKKKKQTYCLDSTNLDINYSRNLIRNVIMPELVKVNAQSVLHINQAAERMRETSSYLEKEAKEALKEHLEFGQDYARISSKKLLSYDLVIAKEMVRQMLFYVAGQQKDLSAVHVEAVLELAKGQSGKSTDLPYQMTVEKVFDRLTITKAEARESLAERCMGAPVEPLIISDQELLELYANLGMEKSYALSNGEALILKVCKLEWDAVEIPKKAYTKWLNYDKMKSGFVVRNRKEKDFLVMDAAGHRKKLKTYFIEEKIPVAERDSMLLIAQDSEVAWVVGKRLNEAYKVPGDATYVLEIKYKGGK